MLGLLYQQFTFIYFLLIEGFIIARSSMLSKAHMYEDKKLDLEVCFILPTLLT